MAISRRLRGLLGTAVIWGVAIAGFSTMSLLLGFLIGDVPDVMRSPFMITMVALRGFIAGALAGSLFSLLLVRKERNRSLEQLSPRRAAIWGFLGAAGMPLVFGLALGVAGLIPPVVFVTGSLLFGVGGALLGAGTVKMARRAPALPSGAHSLLELEPPSES